MNKVGSAIILVFSLFSVVGIIATIFVRSSSLFYSFSVDRMVHTRHILALESLAQYATAQYQAIRKKGKKSWEEIVTSWPPLEGSCSGSIKASYANKITNMRILLFKKNNPIGSIQWSIRHKKEGDEISPWNYDVS